MPQQSRSPDLDSMRGEVDRLLRQLNPPAPGATRPSTMTAPLPRTRPRRRPPPPPPPIRLPSRHGVWGRVALVALLTAAVTQWPYRLCGFPLAGYLAAVTVVLVAAGWAAHASWRRRMGIAHIIAIVLIMAGATLTAMQILPRFGYAAVEMAWRCPL